jgi:hypothetical protein
MNEVSIQNVDPENAHDVTVDFYDEVGNPQHTEVHTIPIHGQYNFHRKLS